jgi:hypothetical protein
MNFDTGVSIFVAVCILLVGLWVSQDLPRYNMDEHYRLMAEMDLVHECKMEIQREKYAELIKEFRDI